MMRDADTAMYQAKRAGKARHEVFDEKMHKAAKETLRLETDLRRAIQRGEIEVHYQPIYSLTTGDLDGVEALARWKHPELGEIPPQRFIDLAEEIGAIDALGEMVMRRACLEFAQIRSAVEPRQISLSVNLSCRQFANPKLVESIRTILSETGFHPTQFKLEITETVFFEYRQKAIEMLHQLRDMGIELNVDDFGTGYSNLGYLASLPISSLKIDRSFVAMFDETGVSPAIVQTIVMLARNLGLRVVAEGVETESQLEELRKLDCDTAQGYFFAPPMNVAEICLFLSENALSAGRDGSFSDIQSVPVLQ
jgi:EAL domain-containing protein (putative c-di-GMP-specific phosphodiesterase class I)